MEKITLFKIWMQSPLSAFCVLTFICTLFWKFPLLCILMSYDSGWITLNFSIWMQPSSLQLRRLHPYSKKGISHLNVVRKILFRVWPARSRFDHWPARSRSDHWPARSRSDPWPTRSRSDPNWNRLQIRMVPIYSKGNTSDICINLMRSGIQILELLWKKMDPDLVPDRTYNQEKYKCVKLSSHSNLNAKE